MSCQGAGLKNRVSGFDAGCLTTLTANMSRATRDFDNKTLATAFLATSQTLLRRLRLLANAAIEKFRNRVLVGSLPSSLI